MLKKRLLPILLALISIAALSSCADAAEDIAQNSIDIVESEDINILSNGSIDMNRYNKELTTASCTPGDNAADFTSLKIKAQTGDIIAFDDIGFTGKKCLMLVAAIPQGSTDKKIELYIDDVSEPCRIGTLTTNSHSKVCDFDFNEQYALLTKEISGAHRLIFRFSEPVELEADWFKLTSYTGSETEDERNQRMKWWREAKFGQFIHFGAYSYLGGEYLGQKAGWYSEWLMNSLSVSKEDYAKNAASHFNPKSFDAKKIVSDAKAAGQKYIIITSRHHEGLSIYDTKIRCFKDYCVLNKNSCPEYEGGDFMMELAQECRRQGLHFGTYITIMDWHDPSQTGLNNSTIDQGYTKEEYKSRLKGQLKELIKDYGSEVFFFDGEWVSWWTEEDGREVYRYILSLNENCIVNNRVGKRQPSDGDYSTPEQEVPASGLDYDWESNVTMNDSWGYKKGGENWKSPQWIVNTVVDIVSKGGNLLLNVGPDGDGVVEQAPLDNMAAAGKWFKRFSQVIYGTEKSCFSKAVGGSIRITTKPAEGRIFVILLEDDPKAIGSIMLPALENDILGVTELASGSDLPYDVINGSIILQVSGTEQQDYATVYEITVNGEPKKKNMGDSSGNNIARGKTAEVSSCYDGKGGDRLTDGDSSATNDNRWAPLDSDNSPWAIIDLGELKSVREVVIYEWLDTFFTHDYRVKDFKIAISSDKIDWQEVYSGGAIGERLCADLGKAVECRYVKFYNISRVSGAKGTPSFHAIEVYEKHRLNPQISFADIPEKIDSATYTVKGRYADGSKVTVRVWGASFAAFEIEATTDDKTGTWEAHLDTASLSSGSITLTAILSDKNGCQFTADSITVEY